MLILPNKLFYSFFIKTFFTPEILIYLLAKIKKPNIKFGFRKARRFILYYISPIEKSRDLLLSGAVEAEFRTTVVKGLHTRESLTETAKWISGASEYYLQQFKDSGDILSSAGLSAFDREEMLSLAEAVRPYVPSVQIRGV